MTYFGNRFSYDLPYPSRRAPVLARNVVATSQPLATAAGLHALRQGGNAVDAVLAAAITLTVVEPVANGIGGDAFCILWDGKEFHGLNASGRSPAALDAGRFAGTNAMPVYGWDPVTVPGAPSAWAALSERFGRLEFSQLFSEAIRHARDGFLVSPITAAAWKRAEAVHGAQPDFARAFLPDGHAPAAGDLFRHPEQAQTLDIIAASKAEEFYRGGLAQKIAAHAAATGGLMTEDDLASHRPEWVRPLELQAFGVSLHEIPPNGQGVASLIALGMLRHFNLTDLHPDSAAAIHLQVEAMKLAFADAFACVSDPDTMEVTVEQLLDDVRLEERAALIDRARAGTYGPGGPARGGTVCLSAADADGMMVSFIQSNYMGFGSGIVVPRTGISLQNRGAGFSLEPGHPNVVAGGKRPFHTIIPGFVSEGGQPRMAFGLMGGHMQAQGHVQMTLRTVVWDQNPQAASDAPRWQLLEDGRLAVEEGLAAAAELAEMGHDVVVQPEGVFGGAQLIARLPGGGYLAGSDHRKDGLAAGF